MRAFFAVLFIFISLSVQAGIVEFHDDQLFIDGSPQPQLYGAELQYFRLRGGYGKNVPRAKVIELWNKALDRMVEAKMNTISFYIPWDFHEYAEGKFDFTGTVDEDGDGNPDYPSRDLQTFFKLIEARGITRIMARPGPYINAEWGFLGFGAVPKWFHDKFPESHMRTSLGLKSKL
jgi:beta-galactosidase